MGIYVRVLAVALAYGGIVHIANIAGLGEKPWLDGPLAWRLGDLVYAPLDIAGAIGLRLRQPWGVVVFLVAVFSLFVIYTVFIEHFAFTADHRKTVYGLLLTQGLLTVGLFRCLAAQAVTKRPRPPGWLSRSCGQPAWRRDDLGAAAGGLRRSHRAAGKRAGERGQSLLDCRRR